MNFLQMLNYIFLRKPIYNINHFIKVVKEKIRYLKLKTNIK